MAALDLPPPYDSVDALIEKQDFAGARAALRSTTGYPALAELCEVKIALLEGTLEPQFAMNRLLSLMRKDAKLPGAHALYKAASEVSYQSGHSSLSHSHPPPPMKPSGGDDD